MAYSQEVFCKFSLIIFLIGGLSVSELFFEKSALQKVDKISPKIATKNLLIKQAFCKLILQNPKNIILKMSSNTMNNNIN